VTYGESEPGISTEGIESMSDLFGSLGFPPLEQRDSIRFYFAKGLSYHARTRLILGCLFAGLVLQIVTVWVWPGLPFLLIAVMLGLVKGYDSRVRLKGFRNDQTWTEVPIEKFREIETVRKKAKAWDLDLFDVTNALGGLVFLALIVIGVFLGILAGLFAGDPNISLIIVVDSLILVVPFYFTGVRWALKQGNLAIKVNLLLTLHDYFERHKIESESFIPMLLLAHEGNSKSVPIDAKFQIRYKGLPPDRFYGLQSTVNINLVQGTSYPYFYCVLVAKAGLGLKKYQSGVKISNYVLCEYNSQTNAEVLVIRHPTTKNSGYHTDETACREILSAAMGAARIIESEFRQQAP
jgi:hypothetical protein